MPWREISRSARSATPACSPRASRRIRSWQGWQMPPFKVSEGFAQIMHFLFASLIIFDLSSIANLARRLMQNFKLLGVLDDDLQTILRVVFDLADDLDFFVLEILRQKFALFK
jgi:hypothetical protein